VSDLARAPVNGPVTVSQLLTAEQVAERWQVAPAHVYRLSREGKLPVVRLGRYYRYRLEAIEAFERGGGTDVDQAT
jgi:excisionase family DNA binding protein